MQECILEFEEFAIRQDDRIETVTGDSEPAPVGDLVVDRAEGTGRACVMIDIFAVGTRSI